jgi:hypothetical protein
MLKVHCLTRFINSSRPRSLPREYDAEKYMKCIRKGLSIPAVFIQSMFWAHVNKIKKSKGKYAGRKK